MSEFIFIFLIVVFFIFKIWLLSTKEDFHDFFPIFFKKKDEEKEIPEEPVDKYLQESRDALERIKKDPSIILGDQKIIKPEVNSITPNTKEVDYLLGGVPHKWDGTKFIQKD